MRSAAEIGKFSLRIKSDFAVFQILQKIEFIFIALFLKKMMASAFGTSFRI